MGYDIGFHAIDIKNIFDDITPYIKGENKSLKVLNSAYFVARNRYIANAWGAKVSDYLENRESKNFNEWLYLWGRPFFITEDNKSSVCEAISFYINETDQKKIENCIRQQIEIIDKDIFRNLDFPDLVGLADGKVWMANVLSPINMLREAYKKLAQHPSLINKLFRKQTSSFMMMPDGTKRSNHDVLYHHLLFSIIEFCAYFSPSWMERGRVWPSLLIEDAGLDCNLIMGGDILLKDFIDVIPEFKQPLPKTICENYSVGGVVLPENISAFRQFCLEHREALSYRAKQENWPNEFNLAFQKLDECLFYAEKHQMAFIETSEVVSGFLGKVS